MPGFKTAFLQWSFKLRPIMSWFWIWQSITFEKIPCLKSGNRQILKTWSRSGSIKPLRSAISDRYLIRQEPDKFPWYSHNPRMRESFPSNEWSLEKRKGLFFTISWRISKARLILQTGMDRKTCSTFSWSRFFREMPFLLIYARRRKSDSVWLYLQICRRADADSFLFEHFVRKRDEKQSKEFEVANSDCFVTYRLSTRFETQK